jgi:competence protein ComEA
MRGWRNGESEDLVRERFVRVVGLPTVADLPRRPDVPTVADLPTVADRSAVPEPDPEPDPAPGRRGLDRSGLAAFDPGRRGVRALAVVAVLAVAAAGFVAWRARPDAQPVPVRASISAPTGTVSSGGSASVLVVAVAGRVQRPGLVRLPAGARVADAIEAAGGALPGTDLSFVNLARKLVDGELVVIGVTPPPGAVDNNGGGTGAASGPVNLNTATTAQLESLPGVGPVTAQRIIDYRTKHGGFRSVSELRQVEGVGDTRFAQLKDLVTV